MKINTISNAYKPVSFKADSTATPITEPVKTAPEGTVSLPTPIASDTPQFSKSVTKLKDPSLVEKIAKFFREFGKKPSYRNPLEYQPGMNMDDMIALAGVRASAL